MSSFYDTSIQDWQYDRREYKVVTALTRSQERGRGACKRDESDRLSLK